MPKRGSIELSTGFIVMLILGIAVFGMGIWFAQKLFFSADSKVNQADDQAKLDMARLRNEGQTVGLVPQTIEEHGTILLMIANDASVGSSQFGFKVSYDDCFNGDCSAASPMDWITYSSKGNEDEPIEIEPYESREFMIAVNAKNAPSGTYVFDVDVRYETVPPDGIIIYDESDPDVDALYSRLKFYIQI